MEKIVEDNFPAKLHNWPIIKTFDFESYIWKGTHIVFILRDKVSGIITGSGKPKGIIDSYNASEESPTVANISKWQNYLQKKFSVRPQDAVFIIPLIDSGKNTEDDWELWNESDKQLWSKQLELIITRQYYYLQGIDIAKDFYIPPGYDFLKEEYIKFFKDHPHYNRNVFIMTRFVQGNKLLQILDVELRGVLKSNGLEPLRADDKMYIPDRNLWNNVCVYMICSKYGIAVLEDRVANEFNPNVAIEYGFMRALNKPVLLLTDIGFRNLRADIIGTLRGGFDIYNTKETIRRPTEKWLRELNISNK